MHACILLEEYKYMYVCRFALYIPMVADILIFCSEQMHTPLGAPGDFFVRIFNVLLRTGRATIGSCEER